jgi:hypothetical protein
VLALGLAACSGKVSIGHNGTTMQPLDPTAVSSMVAEACPAGSAHPNVCCTAAPGQQTSCGTYPDAPFEACDKGSQTYPDPRSCCSLDGANDCTPAGGGSASTSTSSSGPGVVMSGSASASTAGAPSPAVSGSACAYACPIGYYVPANPSPGECCASLGAGAVECFGMASSAGQTSACPACPSGWQVPEGEPGLCCQDEPDGMIECFSQAVPPALAPSTVAPTPASSFACGGSAAVAGPDGGPAVGGCVCKGTVSGHVYGLNCPSGGGACACTVDDVSVGQVSPGSGGCTDQSSSALLQQCGFPTQ